jgi:type III pantothenate kinase
MPAGELRGASFTRRLLAVDIGNTHIVLGVLVEGRLSAHWRLATSHARTIDESWVVLRTLFQSAGLDPRALSGVAIASVVPDLNFVWLKLAEHYLRVSPFLLSWDAPGVPEIRLPDPSTVGADRLCNAAAIWHLHRQAAVVVDFGTATTFDVVHADGAFLGGLILPGPQSALRNLHQNAALLPKVALAFPERVIGVTTEQAMQSGLLHGAVAQVEGLVARISAELEASGVPGPLRVVSTGGFGRIMARQTPVIERHLPYLVLHGLALVAARAKGEPELLPVEIQTERLPGSGAADE